MKKQYINLANTTMYISVPNNRSFYQIYKIHIKNLDCFVQRISTILPIELHTSARASEALCSSNIWIRIIFGECTRASLCGGLDFGNELVTAYYWCAKVSGICEKFHHATENVRVPLRAHSANSPVECFEISHRKENVRFRGVLFLWRDSCGFKSSKWRVS